MSWLKLKRLISSKKVWKVLTKNLPLKLHKLSKSKANKKKLKYPSYKTTKKFGWPLSLSIQPKKFKTHPHTLIRHRNHKYNFHKRPPPVFIDQLFFEPVIAMKESVHTPSVAVKESTSKEESSSTSNMKKGEILDKNGADDHSMISADEMWESMVVASPQMNGINERADEFIARIKAEMRHQEMMARRL